MGRIKDSDVESFPSRPMGVYLCLLWAFTLSLIIAVGAATYWTIQRDRGNEYLTTNQVNANLAKVLEAHTISILRNAEQVAHIVQARYEGEGERLDIASLVSRGEINDRYFNQIGVIDKNGLYVASNLKNFQRLDLSDREHFRVHRDAQIKGGIYISNPVKGRASGKWSIQLTKRINKVDGSFDGVVVVSMDPGTFLPVYGDMRMGDGGVVSLYGLDGGVRARRVGRDTTESIGKVTKLDVASSRLMLAARGAYSGNYVAASPIDGVTRIVSWRKVDDYPLVVLVGVSQSEALADFEERAANYRLFCAALVVLTMMFAVATTLMLGRIGVSWAELKKAKAAAEDANSVKTMFLSNMSHELRTPLMAILGYAEALQEEDAYGALAGAQRRGLRRIEESGHHLLALVTDVIEMAKLQGGKLVPLMRDVDVRVACRESLSLVAVTANDERINIDFKIAPDVAGVRADERWLRQILVNLLSNAIKFTGPTREVGLNVFASGGFVNFVVWDAGPGISAHDMERLFRPFEQLDSGLNRKNEGSGLGLALSQGMAMGMNGRIEVESEVGRGARFTLVLPVHAES